MLLPVGVVAGFSSTDEALVPAPPPHPATATSTTDAASRTARIKVLFIYQSSNAKPRITIIHPPGRVVRFPHAWRNVRQELAGLLKQSVYARLAGYEDVNDQEVLARDPAHGGLFSDLPERIRCLAAVPR